MKKNIFLLIFMVISVISVAQLPIKFKSVEQSSTIPEDGELYFINYYSVKPINVYFDGKIVIMKYDNGSVYLKRNVKSYEIKKIIEDNKQILIYNIDVSFGDEKTRNDSLKIIIDYRFSKISQEIIIPTKDHYGENYTSFRRFIKYIK